jgi:hypothetical protein
MKNSSSFAGQPAIAAEKNYVGKKIWSAENVSIIIGF